MRTLQTLVLLGTLLILVPTASAVKIEDCQGDDEGTGGYDPNDPCAKSAKGIDKLVDAVQIIAGPILGLVVVASMFMWGVVSGNENTKKAARATCIGGLVGVALVMLADPIVDFVRTSFA